MNEGGCVLLLWGGGVREVFVGGVLLVMWGED